MISFVAGCVWSAVILSLSLCSAEYPRNETFLWKPRGWKGLQLYCPKQCNISPSTGDTKDVCCACKAESLLDYNHHFSHLNISKDGRLEGNTSADNIAVDYSGKHLVDFPHNICDFPGITRINFSSNHILEIPNLSCLPNLTHLDLSWNSLSALSNDSLTENWNLRFVNLSHNFITYIETGVLATMASHSINLTGNSLISVDVTDIIFERPFCKFSFSHNKLHILVNKNNWKMNLIKKYGPGFVDFTFNQFKTMPDATKLGFKNFFDLGKLFDFGFDIRHNPLICDCRIARFLLFFKQYIDIMDRDYFNITCEFPEAFRGRSLPSIIRKGEIEDLICNYTSLTVCPKRCQCIDRPKRASPSEPKMKLVLNMNCTGAKINHLPHILPHCDEIEFDLRGTPIREITTEHYLELVTVLELPGMPSFETGALENLTHLQVFSVPRSDQLSGIPPALSSLNPCVFLQRGDFVMNCTCSHIWMVDWIQTKAIKKCSPHSFQCLNGGDTEQLLTYLPRLVCTETHHEYLLLLSITSATIFFFIVLIFIYIWKYEFKIMIRSNWICTRPKKYVDQDCVVYLSYDEKMKDIDSWLINTLEPFLTRNGLATFIPSRDLPLGCVRVDETAWQISVSRHYIIFLSDNYFEEDSFQTHTEWKHIWNNYFYDSRKKLLIINYDLLNSTQVPCGKFRAVMRINDVVDFASGEKKIFSKISATFKG
ncbi:uncharacterized protein LOC125650348 [Ostrea edulis]|uniref:uncharacterized protein LOC125650348 n=1 Tax=Ostrea edulis TaxID=37623 RepID=UPI002095F1B7|nr:uncharacterized protein LOC125650348 [Ostrea edulis]XP_048734524.1 uncharacterized protein LOC125650348 [Ostrea edulis]